MKGRRPDWRICLKHSGDDRGWIEIGAAWTTDRGGISIRFNDDWKDAIYGGDWHMMLFPRDDDYERPRRTWSEPARVD